MLMMFEMTNMAVLGSIAIFFGLFVLAVWIWALVDCITSKSEPQDKLLWLAIIFFFNIFGAIIYLAIGRDKKRIVSARESKASDSRGRSKDKKRLVKDRKDSMVEGVCSGMAKYLDVDVTLVRLLWILAIFLTQGMALLFYIIAAVVMPNPEDSKKSSAKASSSKTSSDGKKAIWIVIILAILFILVPFLIFGVGMVSLFAFVNSAEISVDADGIPHSRVTDAIRIEESIIRQEEIHRTKDSISDIMNLVAEQIRKEHNYMEYNGSGLMFMGNYRPTEGCYDYDEHCMGIVFRFDVDTDALPESVVGFYVDAIVVDYEIEAMGFTEYGRDEWLSS